MTNILIKYKILFKNTIKRQFMNYQEKELLEGYRKLKPESRQLIMSMVASAVESVFNPQQVQKRQFSDKKQDTNEIYFTKYKI